MRGLLALPLVLLAFAGCLQPPAPDLASAATLRMDGADPSDLIRWNGTGLQGPPYSGQRQLNDHRCWANLPCDPSLAPCEEASCERRPFSIGEGVGALTLSVRWPSVPDDKFDAWIEDADGAILASAPHAYSGYIGLVARLTDPAPGDYTAVIVARAGSTSYQAGLRAEPATVEDAPRQLLPNLVTLPPTDLILDTPAYAGVSYFAFPVPGVREIGEAAGSKGCRIDERIERQATRCLRFSNAVANAGEGPLDVRLAPGSLAFTQFVHASDGTTEQHTAGAAEWHAWHAHWHNAAGNLYTLHTYDVATGERGPPLGEGRKGGICFADTATTDVGLPIMRPATYSGWGCFDPRSAPDEPAWAMGISPGWYDLYPYLLSDQYVDASMLEDGGTYAVCSTTNSDGMLLESDLSDNEACTRFRVSGDAVDLLDPEPYHTIPPEYRI